jgi:chromosome segregation ATPase
MSSEYDEFVDKDFQGARKTSSAQPSAPGTADPERAPTRQEVEAKVGEMQHKLAELKRAQQELERERAVLEETRRRQMEFTQGRQEMVQHLTRGVAILEEAEFAARRDAEQMAKTLIDLRESLVKLQGIQEETWTRDSLNVELTRASTIVENARMEWNAARLKFAMLSAETVKEPAPAPPGHSPLQEFLSQKSYAELCKLGLALTWPVALAVLCVLVLLALRH